MKEDEFADQLEDLWKKLGSKTQRSNKEILREIEEIEKKIDENKIKPSTSGKGPEQTSILPHGELPGKKVVTMKIKKRRIDTEPMGF